MDFFERQDRARRQTGRLIFYFILSTLLTTALIYVALALIVFRRDIEDHGIGPLWNPPLLGMVVLGTWVVILGGSLYKIGLLSRGGGAVARSLGGELIPLHTTDPDERKVLNVVEEMAIASGTPVPEVYLLKAEQGINAFAAGHRPDQAAIGVTRGCVQALSRDELQGVVAHEFSHILNGDMRLNLRLMGMVHGLVCIAIIGRILLRTAGRASRARYAILGARDRSKGGNPLPIIGLILMLVGSIGVFFGRLIKSAVSRQREFLADASAVQFTRNPGGLAGALKKIGGLIYGSLLQSPRAEEASHLFFGNGLRASWFQAFATHPPLVDRIRAIDPSFDGVFPKVQLPPPAMPSQGEVPPQPPSPAQRFKARPPSLSDLLGPAAGLSVPVRSMVASVGQPDANHLNAATAMLAALPIELTQGAREPFSACAIVYGLLISAEAPIREEQWRALEPRLAPPMAVELRRLSPYLEALPRTLRLPLLELACSGLRSLSPDQFQSFMQTTELLVAGDRQLDLFEFALQRLLDRHLRPHFETMPRRVAQYHSLHPLRPDIVVVLSALARLGHQEPDLAQRAFALGVSHLGSDTQDMSLLPLDQCRLDAISRALDRVACASPPLRKLVLRAAAETVAADGQIQAKEAELLRAVADGMDCPMPPALLSGQKSA